MLFLIMLNLVTKSHRYKMFERTSIRIGESIH